MATQRISSAIVHSTAVCDGMMKFNMHLWSTARHALSVKSKQYSSWFRRTRLTILRHCAICSSSSAYYLIISSSLSESIMAVSVTAVHCVNLDITYTPRNVIYAGLFFLKMIHRNNIMMYRFPSSSAVQSTRIGENPKTVMKPYKSSFQISFCVAIYNKYCIYDYIEYSAFIHWFYHIGCSNDCFNI